MPSLTCPLCCGRSFGNRKSLRYHLLSSVENFCCPECSNHFNTLAELSDHLSTLCTKEVDRENSSQTTNACPLCCGRCFASRKSLWYHLLSSAENVSCPECKQHFSTILDLSDHLDSLCKKPFDDTIKSSSKSSAVATETSDAKLEHCNAGPAKELDVEPAAVSVKEEMFQEDALAAMAVEGCEIVEVADYAWDEGNEEETHFCSSCQVKIKSVVEHISSHHPYQTVYYETGTSAEEVEASDYMAQELANLTENSEEIAYSEQPEETTTAESFDIGEDEEQMSENNYEDEGREEVAIANETVTSNERVDRIIERENILVKDISLVTEKNMYLDNNLVTDATTQYLHGRGLPANLSRKLVSPKTQENNQGDLLRATLTAPRKINSKSVTLSSNSLSLVRGEELVPIGVKDSKTGFPKIVGTVNSSDLVDAKTGIPYVRKVVRIEKFWENSKTYTASGNSNIETGEVNILQMSPPKKKRQTPGKRVKVVHELEEPSVFVQQSHLENLLRTGTTVSHKQDLPQSYLDENGVLVEDHSLNKSNNRNSAKKPKRYVLKNGVYVAEESSIKKMFGHEYAKNQPEVVDIEAAFDESIHVNFNKADSEPSRVSILKFEQSVGENMKPIYSCSKCAKEFSNPERFKTHACRLLKKSGPVNLVCDLCGITCKTPRNLRVHRESHNPEHKERLRARRLARKAIANAKPSVCQICKTQFTTFGGLRMHMRMHRPDNVKKIAEMNNKCEFRCDICLMVCYSERTFRIHYKIHYPEPETITADLTAVEELPAEVDSLLCKHCFMSFTNDNELNEHCLTHCIEQSTNEVAGEETVRCVESFPSVDDDEYFTCTLCGKNMSSSLRDDHEEMHENSFLMFCGKCNKHFRTKTQLELHITHAHEHDANLVCPHCKIKFSDETLLRTHVLQHTGVPRPYPCGFCGRRFGRPHEKVKHERIHTGEMPYQCAVCSMRFRVAYCLKMHERIHTGVRPYSCDQCGKTFRTRSGYKQHVRIHSELRPYQCKLCPKTFKTVVQLSGHRKSHTKPYTCSECGRRFANMFTLRNHLDEHEKDNGLKHKCHICGAAYGRDYSLKDHLKTHGKMTTAPPAESPPPADSSQDDSGSNDSE